MDSLSLRLSGLGAAKKCPWSPIMPDAGIRLIVKLPSINLTHMIFLDPTIDGSDDFYVLGKYYPSTDPKFKEDDFSKTLLALKYRHDTDEKPEDWKLRNRKRAIERFLGGLDPLLSSDIAITVVPSSDPAASMSGIHELAQVLAAKGRLDATECLVRFERINKLATGGDRGIERHLNSMRVEHSELIQGREVLLLDDVTTSGNSLSAGRQLLLKAGAKRVKCMVLGRTTRSEENV